VLFGVEGKPILSVPYDFDQAGIVDARHASPNPHFRGLRNVKQRLYRGRCVNNHLLDSTIASFRDRQGDILQLINELAALDNRARNKVTVYVNRFYETFESEKKIVSEFVKKCI
jgi:hypothetical protein